MTSNPTALRRRLPASARPLSGVAEGFFVHAPSSKVHQVAALCAGDQIGAIYTVPRGSSRIAKLAETLATHRSIAGDSTVMADPQLYAGKNRMPASAALEIDWIRHQWDHGLPWALTDSGYVERDAIDDLRALFASGEQIARRVSGNFLLAVPADFRWVSERPEELRDLVESYGIPVAYMFGASGDPLGRKRAVEGLLHLLASPVPSTLLRTDLSAVGALAAGAPLAAMGTSSSLRHIFPPKSGGPGRLMHPSAMLPNGLSLHRIDVLARAIALTPDEVHWRCDCDHCLGARLDNIIDGDQAFIHNVYSACDLVRHVLAGGVKDALASWAAMCRNAQFVHLDIDSSTQNWNYPTFHGAWREVA